MTKKKEKTKYENLNKFFSKNSGLLSVLSIFLVFLSVSGKDFLPEINGIKLSILSNFLWLSGILIIIICLIILVKESWINENCKSVKIFGAILFLALFCSIMYTFFAVILNKEIFSVIINIPKSIPIALSVMASPWIFMLINKIKIKWILWIVYLILPLSALIFLLINLGIQNWSNQLVNLKILYWFAFSVLISFVSSIYYKLKKNS